MTTLFMNNRIQVIFIIFSLLLSPSLQDCMFTVDTDGVPRAVKGDEKYPSEHVYIQDPICAKIFPGKNCCNDYQNNQMASNFLQIDATFGSIGNGCDNCASNLKRFWCTYTCAPYQDEFLTIGPDLIVVPNPLDEGQTTLAVQDIQIVIQSDTVCNIWTSCNMTPYANQVSAMKTPAGFLSFLGQNGVTQALQYISMSYTSENTPQPITVNDVTPCNAPQPPQDVLAPLKKQPYFPDQYGFNISQACSCNNCELSCTASSFTPLSVMEGFNWLVVGLFYGFLVLFTIGIWYYRKRKTESKNYSRRQSLVDNMNSDQDNYQPASTGLNKNTQ